MQHIPTTGVAVSKLRKSAKLLVRDNPELKHAQALDAVAKEASYSDWQHVLRCTKQGAALEERNAVQQLRNESIERNWQRLQSEILVDALEKSRLWSIRLAQALDWLETQHSDKALGMKPQVRMLEHPDTGSLLDFENFGKRGDAVLLTEQSFGKIWWLKLPLSDNLHFHVLGLTNGESGEIVCELHYNRIS
jgi:hypothetical protein